MLVVCGLMLFAGCSGNNVGTSPSVPEAVAGAGGAGAEGTAQPFQIDSTSSGGSSLTAAAPYAGDGKTAAQQNVNPMPFMTASTPMKAGMAMPAAGSALVSRADGTMSGPTDMSAAGSDAGMSAMSHIVAMPSQGAAGKPATAPKANPASKPATPK